MADETLTSSGKLIDQPLYVVESVGRDTRWSAIFLRITVALNVLCDMTFLALFLVIVLSLKMQLQYGIVWIVYTAVQGGLLVFYLIALFAYYLKNHQDGVPIFPHATSMVVLHGFICLLVAYGVIVTAQKVWLAKYPVNWLGTAPESSPDPTDSTQVITFAVTYLVSSGAATFALLGILMAFVSALYPSRIVNSIISWRASVQSLTSSGGPALGMVPRQLPYVGAAASASPGMFHPHSGMHMMGSSVSYGGQDSAYTQ